MTLHGALVDELSFDDEDAPYELLVPIFGVGATAECLSEMSVRGSMGVTRLTIRRYLSRQTRVI